MSPYKNDVILKYRSKKCCHEKLLSCNMFPCKSVYLFKSDPAYKRVAVKVCPHSNVSPCKSDPSCKSEARENKSLIIN